MAEWLAGLTARKGINSHWLNKGLVAGVIQPGMADDDVYNAIAKMAMGERQPKQLALPMGEAEPDIRALIRYGTSGPGVPVSPAAPTHYTPEMQAQALARGVDSFGIGPRVTERAGGLIPTPIDPRRFTVGDVPPSTAYTPEMMAEAARQGIEIPFPRAAEGAVDPGVRGLPGRVATPDELAAWERQARTYAGGAGRTDDIHAGPDVGTSLMALGRGGPGVTVDGPAGGSRGLITTPSFADQMRSMARRGLNGLGGGELLGAAGVVAGGKLAIDALDGPPAMTTGGEAELANESRPAPVVMPTQTRQDVAWAADEADPAAEAKFTANFKKGYLKREASMHPDVTDLQDHKQQSVLALMRAGIPQARASQIVRGQYSLSPEEMNLLRGAR